MQKGSGQPGACLECGARPGEPGYLRADVPPSDPDFGKLTPCPACHEAALSRRLLASSQLEHDLKAKSFENYNPTPQNSDGYKAARHFANHPVGWLTLWGPYGTGKTHLLAAIGNYLIARQSGVVYYTLAGLMDMLRGAVGRGDLDGAFHRAIVIPVLIIDELGVLNQTPWAMERVRELLDARYRALTERGTVFATNTEPRITGGEWDWLVSRMNDRRNEVVQVGGGDMRPAG